jgi:N-carbamoylputrescine amidase
MSRIVRIACIQQHAQRDKQDNLKRGIEAYEEAASQGAQIIIFPELAFTIFYPQKPASGNIMELAEPIPGPTSDTFAQLARKWQVVTIINLFERRDNATYDASPVFDADGSLLGVTRMVHILEAPGFHEQGYYTPGPAGPLVYETTLGRIGVAICYDRHFPEYMRALALRGAELVVVPQAGSSGEWPAGVFEAEMQIAGFQNGYFVALCNRVGVEEILNFEGKSFVTEPAGQVIAQAPAGMDTTLMVDIDLDEVHKSQARRHFLADRCPEIYTTWHKISPKLD